LTVPIAMRLTWGRQKDY